MSANSTKLDTRSVAGLGIGSGGPGGAVDLERPQWIDIADWAKRAFNHVGNGFIHWCRRLSLPRKKFNGADHWSVEVERPGA